MPDQLDSKTAPSQQLDMETNKLAHYKMTQYGSTTTIDPSYVTDRDASIHASVSTMKSYGHDCVVERYIWPFAEGAAVDESTVSEHWDNFKQSIKDGVETGIFYQTDAGSGMTIYSQDRLSMLEVPSLEDADLSLSEEAIGFLQSF